MFSIFIYSVESKGKEETGVVKLLTGSVRIYKYMLLLFF